MSDVEVKVEGLDDLQQSFERLVKKYPDAAGDLVRKEGFRTRGQIVKEIKGAVDVNDGNAKSLGKAASYKVTEVKGLGTRQYVEICAKAPHFHLIEHGHRLTDKFGNSRGRGWVQGYNILDPVQKKRQAKMPEEVSEMVDKLLKEEGFL